MAEIQLDTFKDGETIVNSSFMGEISNVKSVGTSFLEMIDPFNYSKTEELLIIKRGTIIPFFDGSKWSQIVFKNDVSFNPKTILDTGQTFDYGADYWVYIVVNSAKPSLVVSKNMSYPAGATADNSRRIGHFHYGAVRRVSNDGKYIPIGTDNVKFSSTWKNNVGMGIIPNSVWDLKHRPRVEHPGLAEVHGKWFGIYQLSQDDSDHVTFHVTNGTSNISGGTLCTQYGKLPVTGTEGLTQYSFNELLFKQGLRLPLYSEWLNAAFGNPVGENSANNYGWTHTSNTARTYTGCNVSTSTGQYLSSGGVKPYAVSAYNLCDCVGNVWEWLGDYTLRGDSSWNWYSIGSDANVGTSYLAHSTGMSAFIAGGHWAYGARVGCRSVNLHDYPWNVDTYSGARACCDAL